MNKYELTFYWPTGDWTWTYVECRDFHDAMLYALLKCPDGCRVKSILLMPPVSTTVTNTPTLNELLGDF